MTVLDNVIDMFVNYNACILEFISCVVGVRKGPKLVSVDPGIFRISRN